jgi:exo-1,4-beta-D-glucosaminidase
MRVAFTEFSLGDFMSETSLRSGARPNATRAAYLRSRLLTFSSCVGALALGFAILAGPSSTHAQSGDSSTSILALHANWQIQSSAKILGGGGSAISQPGFPSPEWYPATVPTTVVAALVDDKIYNDPYYGMAMRSLPGVKYKIGQNFSEDDIPKDSPFHVSWWYRTQFDVPAAWRGKSLWLNFRGINYRANIWLNGKQIAKAEDVAGAFRRYEYDVTSDVTPGEANALAVEVFPPTPHDLAITFVDWNPLPPDKDMGIWGDVFLTASGPVAIRNAEVETKFDLPNLDTAHLTVRAEARNATAQPVQGVLLGAIGDAAFDQPVSLGPHEAKEITFTPAQFHQLNFDHPKIWWPYSMGAQDMYDLYLEFDVGQAKSDQLTRHFGIDQITSRMTGKGHLQFSVNGKDVLVRGGGWTPDMMLREEPRRWEQDFRYVRGMNLNTVRLEGKLMSDEFFDLADRYGVLVMAGWCCCDHWERWSRWTGDERKVATASLRDQATRLRSHPSVLVWLNGSDNPPPADIEKAYLAVLKDVHWPKPVISSASEKKTSVTGPSGVKMTGPYDYVPPNYWLEDHEYGGAFGFNTETSPGPAIPPIDSLKQMMPEKQLWPVNEFWDFHAGGGQFKDVNIFNEALTKRYGPPRNLADYEWKSQAAAYEGERAMFEAFGRNRGTATGVIQWMLNNAWPSIIWHLYDYYLRPGGGYFGTKKACEPLHVQYSYDDNTIVVVNDELASYTGLKVTAKAYDINAAEKYSNSQTVDSPASSATVAFKVPEIKGISTTYFLKLTLEDSSGAAVSQNFYWLSTKLDELEWDGYSWYTTPQKAFADLHDLARLTPVSLKYSTDTIRHEVEGATSVHITNPSDRLAFMIHLRLTRGMNGPEVLPILWDDNYFELLPGESRDIKAVYRLSDLGNIAPELEVSGWNVSNASPD